LEGLKGKQHLADFGVNGRIILTIISEKQGRKVWSRFMWLGTETDGGLLWTY
jgi:hypothetical protein